MDKPDYLDRIEQLKGLKIPYNVNSERDFDSFTATMPIYRRANLFVTRKGNLRAVWKSSDTAHKHVGAEFLGNGWVKCVVWNSDDGMLGFNNRHSEQTSFAGFKKILKDARLLSFLRLPA